MVITEQEHIVKREVCKACERPIALCYCSLIKSWPNHWPVHLIQHYKEKTHPYGTAKIAQLSLNSINTIELQDQANFMPTSSEADRWQNAILIYPADAIDKETLDIQSLKGKTPRPLVFIDGTWRKSKAIVLGSPFLQKLPRYSFTSSEMPRYRIRKAKRLDFYSTLEAIVTVLNTVENTEHYSQLLEVMDWMVDQQAAFINKQRDAY